MAGIGVVGSEGGRLGGEDPEFSERIAGVTGSGAGSTACSSAEPEPPEQQEIPMAVVGSSPAACLAGEQSEQDGVVIPVDVHESGIVHGVVVPPETLSSRFSDDGPMVPTRDFSSLSPVTEEDGEVIRIEDDEIETAGPQGFVPSSSPPASAPRAIATAPLFEVDRLSSVPPMRPSVRAAMLAARASLPPPRRSRQPSSPVFPSPPSRAGAGLPATAWLEANHRLALARAMARHEVLEGQCRSLSRALLDAEGRLGRALRRVASLESELAGLRESVLKKGAHGQPAVDEEQAGAASGGSASVERGGMVAAQRAGRWTTHPTEVSEGTVEPTAAVVPGRGELRTIEGIGPKLEAGLHRAGITRLAQIAQWTDSDVRRVAKRMKISRSRIIKGQWVERAAEAVRRATRDEA